LQAMLATSSEPIAIEAALDGLLARGLLVPADGGAYTFRHILFRDVAYATLTRAERIRLHTAVADWLEAFAADRTDAYVELIAYHWRGGAPRPPPPAVPPARREGTAPAARLPLRAGGGGRRGRAP